MIWRGCPFRNASFVPSSILDLLLHHCDTAHFPLAPIPASPVILSAAKNPSFPATTDQLIQPQPACHSERSEDSVIAAPPTCSQGVSFDPRAGNTAYPSPADAGAAVAPAIMVALDEVDFRSVDHQEIRGGIAKEEVFVGIRNGFEVIGRNFSFRRIALFRDALLQHVGLGLKIDYQVGAGPME